MQLVTVMAELKWLDRRWEDFMYREANIKGRKKGKSLLYYEGRLEEASSFIV